MSSVSPVSAGDEVAVFPEAARKNYDSLDAEYHLHAEEIERNGYTVLPGLLTADECDRLRRGAHEVYEEEVSELGGLDAMEKVGDVGVSRSPFLKNDTFLVPITLAPVLAIAGYFFGPNFQMNLQRVVMNMPAKKHGAAIWHRDFSYQDFTTSKPLALTAVAMLDGAGPHNGGTLILPGSHRFEQFPSDEFVRQNAVAAECESGDVLLVDSACYHRGGFNTGEAVRHAVVTIYTVPVIRQNVDYPRLLDGKYSDDATLRMLFGYDTRLPHSDLEYRQNKLARNKKIAIDVAY